MEQKDKKLTTWIVIIAAILLISCFILSACAAGLYFFTKTDAESMIGNILRGKNKDNAEEETITITPESSSETEIPDNGNLLTPAQQKIIETAQKIRGLSAKSEFTPVYRNKEELRQYLIDKMYEDTDKQDFIDEHDLLTLLGFIPDDLDLEKFYLDFYSEQIAGFYDHESKEMFLIEGDTEMQNNRTLAHEFTHFLQFDNFDFEGKMNYTDETCETDSEYCLAVEALIEGDATLTEALLSNEKDLNLEKDVSDASSTSNYDAAPKYYQEYLVFPYTYGFDFVYDAYLSGGFDAVDKLYKNPPVSVEQIMHPKRYPDDQPVPILVEPFQNMISKSCELVFDNTLNEADLLWLLNSGYDEAWRLSDSTAQKAAEGWGGGHFQFARCGGKPMFFSKIIWDTKQDADQFTGALTDYNDLRWTSEKGNSFWTGMDGEKIDLIQQADLVYFLISPDTFDSAPLLDLINGGEAM